MKRRTLLGLLGMGGVGLVSGCGRDGVAGSSKNPGPTDGGEVPGTEGMTEEDLSLDPRVPRSLARTDDAELDVALEVLGGALPTDWTGHGFWVHPVPRGQVPVFVGDGKVLRLDFGPDGVFLRSRMVRTPDHYADVATLGHAKGFETDGWTRMSMTLGFRNFTNTALVGLGNRLLVTSDGGRPWELDPETLEAVTPVGWNHEWHGVLPGWMGLFVDWPFPAHLTSAHVVTDPETRELFLVNYATDLIGDSGFTDLMRWDGEGALQRWTLLDQATGLPVEIHQSVHQIEVTRDHVVLMDTAFVVEVAMVGTPQAQAQTPDTTVWIIRRSELDTPGVAYAARVILPREAAHFHADFDDSAGIVLHVPHTPASDASEVLGAGDTLPNGDPIDPALIGLPSAPTDLGAWGRYVINPQTARIVEQDTRYDDNLWGGPALSTWNPLTKGDKRSTLFWASLGLAPELRLQRIEAMYAAHPYRQVPLEELPEEGRAPGLVRIDLDTLEVVDAYAYPPGRMGLSPLFVPREGSRDDLDGYLVATVISDDTETAGSSGDEFWVFDAADLAAGPIARLGHKELNMPFTLHTLWMATAAPRQAAYRVDIREDHAAQVRDLPADLQAMFETDVYPHFDA